jgi:hypothetical protein
LGCGTESNFPLAAGVTSTLTSVFDCTRLKHVYPNCVPAFRALSTSPTAVPRVPHRRNRQKTAPALPEECVHPMAASRLKNRTVSPPSLPPNPGHQTKSRQIKVEKPGRLPSPSSLRNLFMCLPPGASRSFAAEIRPFQSGLRPWGIRANQTESKQIKPKNLPVTTPFRKEPSGRRQRSESHPRGNCPKNPSCRPTIPWRGLCRGTLLSAWTPL